MAREKGGKLQYNEVHLTTWQLLRVICGLYNPLARCCARCCKRKE